MEEFKIACAEYRFDDAMKIFDASSEELQREMANTKVRSIEFPSEYELPILVFTDYDAVVKLARYSDVNMLDVSGVSPLGRAVRRYDLKTTKFLVDRGADVNLCKNCLSPMQFTSIAHSYAVMTEITEALLDGNPDFITNTTMGGNALCTVCNVRGGHTPHCCPARSGNVNVIKCIFEYLERNNLLTAKIVAMYLQGAIGCTDDQFVRRILETYTVSSDDFTYYRDSGFVISNGTMASLLADHGLLTKEYADISLSRAIDNGDIEALQRYLIVGSNPSHRITHPDRFILSPNGYEFFNFLLAKTDYFKDIDVSIFRRMLGETRDRWVTPPNTPIEMRDRIRKLANTIDRIERASHIVLHCPGDEIPSLFDIISFHLENSQ